MAGGVSPRLIGRDEELSALVAALHTARQGQPTAVVLSGEAGIGKSRLLEEFLARARDIGCRTVTGACLDISAGDLPFVPFRQMLRALRQDLGQERLDQLMGEAADDLGLLLPAAGRSSGRTSADGAGPSRVFDLVLHMVDSLATEQPLVMAVEDAHWADRSTLNVLSYVLQSLVDRPLLLVVTHRDDDLPQDVQWRETLSGLTRHPAARGMVLRRLEAEAVAGQVRSISAEADADVVRYAQDWAAGIPLFVEEIVSAASAGTLEEIPRRLADMLRLRLTALSTDAQRVVACVATVGRDVDHRIVAQASELSREALAVAVREAVTRQVLVWRPPSRYGFRHALWREVAYAQLLPAERQAMHRTVAEALDSEARRITRGNVAGDAVVLGELAFHWSQADEDLHAFEASLAAARAAAGAYAYPESLRLYENALIIRDRLADAASPLDDTEFDLLAETVEVSHWTNQTDTTVSLVERALEVADLDRDAKVVRRLLITMEIDLWLGVGDAARVKPWIDRWGDAATQACARSGDLLVAGDYAEAALVARDGLDLARRAGATAQEIKAANLLGVSLVMLGEADSGLAELDAAIALARHVGDRERLIAALSNKSFALEHEGRVEEALTNTVDGIAVASEFGVSSSVGAFLWVNASAESLRLGRLNDAEAFIREAQEQSPSPWIEAILAVYAAEIDTMRGSYVSAESRLVALDKAIKPDDYQVVGQLTAARAELLLWTSRPEAARRILADAIDSLPPDDPQLIVRLLWLVMRSEADLVAAKTKESLEDRDRDEGRAQVILTMAKALAEVPAGPGAAAEMAAYMSLIDAEYGRVRNPTESHAWGRAAQSWSSVPYLSAYCRFQEGVALGVAGQRKRAGEQLREANALAAQYGFGAIENAVPALARALRVSVLAHHGQPNENQSAASESPFNLTPRELQVLRLLTQGLSNRRIARALSVPGRGMSESTASVHVSHILTKLGVTSRTEAAALAHRRGLVASEPY